ncbi:hypothetical protein BIW11_09951 [Tropilaelaps mercedesae]|uniref:Uncharacterized protein n=1 Tax=Tropilaelaps mercedesae TaxID=418985 RepID=A0A1V9XIA8_9ACAR|nr:hypothetical protein BIW11_09951 [Tropilaelaps mercedesae]
MQDAANAWVTGIGRTFYVAQAKRIRKPIGTGGLSYVILTFHKERASKGERGRTFTFNNDTAMRPLQSLCLSLLVHILNSACRSGWGLH